ncbi:MAG TPA: DNA polymerase/3'-5' exonuclease PolX [Phycisphaerae bacterium]|nr:DNA polymerase/3'-5' exonuclease PolX [Phycisphaerae bacterium]
MKNLEIAKLFERTAEVLAVLEENAFRVLAYKKIARVLEELPTDVAQLAEADELENIPGIGKSSAEKIKEYLRTGRISEFDDILAQIPAGVLEIMRIPSVGPKTAALLWHDAGITTVADLVARIDAGTITGIKGIGDKKLQKIKENLAHLATSSGRVRIGEALPIARELVDDLKKIPGVKNAMYCGSLRRGKETIGDIDIAVAANMELGTKIGEAVTKHPLCGSVIQLGESKTSIRTTTGLQVDVRVVPPESWGAAIQYFTGGLSHNVKLREIAVKKGLKINEWGVYKENAKRKTQNTKPGGKAAASGEEDWERIAGDTEESVYAAVGMAWMPPEMREDRGEIELAIENEKSKIEISLVELPDIRGDLHMHTKASDGGNSIEEMVAEAKRRGYQYIAITDHSKSQFQANGLKSDRLLEHIKAIHAVAKEAQKSGILVLAGSEVDILADGSLDYEDDLLEKLDWVVASPHAALTQESDAATQRLIRAAANPHVSVIGHPTGRIVPSRRGLEPDMAKVIFAAARHGVALEINANYHRLDLRDVHVKMAVDAKVPICINTDAHSLEEFDQMQYGILTARRGWATKSDILNTRPLDAFKKWLKDRKELAGW